MGDLGRHGRRWQRFAHTGLSVEFMPGSRGETVTVTATCGSSSASCDINVYAVTSVTAEPPPKGDCQLLCSRSYRNITYIVRCWPLGG